MQISINSTYVIGISTLQHLQMNDWLVISRLPFTPSFINPFATVAQNRMKKALRGAQEEEEKFINPKQSNIHQAKENHITVVVGCRKGQRHQCRPPMT